MTGRGPSLVLRHVVAIGVLPGMVTVVIPLWIAHRYGVSLTLPRTVPDIGLALLGGLVIVVGLGLFAASVRWFAGAGRGTLAPWDPPRHLVVGGPYRFVRNPMISGVVFILAGEAAILRSTPHAWWLVIFAVINATYIPLMEEPMLAARFGARYREYRDHVPRLLPRIRPWRGPEGRPNDHPRAEQIPSSKRRSR